MHFCEPEIPSVYWVDCFTYKCKQCGNIYEITLPNGNDNLAKLKEVNGTEVRWLPICGKGGYVDLLSQLFPEHSHTNTTATTQAFIIELNNYCEQGENGNVFELDKLRHNCTTCNSRDIEIVKEIVLTNPKLTWLKISSCLINGTN